MLEPSIPRAATAPGTYHPLSIGAHWLTLALLAAIYALIEMRGIFPKSSDAHQLMKTWHNMLGLTVFGLVFVRLALRAVYPAPSIDPPPPAWQDTLARAMHWALYAFLLVMPLLGWMLLSAKGKPIPWFGLELPALMAPDRSTAKALEEIHEVIGVLGYGLIGVHAAAALWHHYAMRDDTLHHMWPPARPRPPAGSAPRVAHEPE
ncbi:MAG TPA: cytochrome b [Rubrivivax sp.]|nr:cytochrome b [Rubrivivax sp.]